MLPGLSVAGWFIDDVLFAVNPLRATYAAWDTGPLLVECMKSHDDRRPTEYEEPDFRIAGFYEVERILTLV